MNYKSTIFCFFLLFHLSVGCEIVTVLYSDDFLEGVRVLGYSLVVAGVKLPKTVLVTKGVSSETISVLKKDGWNTEMVNAIRNPHHEEHGARNRLEFVFTKLAIWGRKSERVIYLDGDTIVTSDISELCFCNAQLSAVTRDVFFNAGVMVLTPSESLYQKMISSYNEVPSYNQGEQGFLNQMFPEFQACPYVDPLRGKIPENFSLCLRIPPFYNGDFGLYIARGARWEVDPLLKINTPKIIHFTMGPVKPWYYYSYVLGDSAQWKWYNLFKKVFKKEIPWRSVSAFLKGALPFIVLSIFVNLKTTITHSTQLNQWWICGVHMIAALVAFFVSTWVPFVHPFYNAMIMICIFVSVVMALFIPKKQTIYIIYLTFSCAWLAYCLLHPISLFIKPVLFVGWCLLTFSYVIQKVK